MPSITRAVIIAAALAACRPARVAAPAPVPGACAGRVDLAPEDVCPGLFTADGRPCAQCPGARACAVLDLGVYCAGAACGFDPVCRVEMDPHDPAPVK